MSDMKSVNAELVAQLRGLETQVFPWCKGIAAALSLAFLVVGLIMGRAIHTSMIAFGNSLFIIGAVLTVFMWDIASTISLLTGVLDMSFGMQYEVLANTLREYLHPMHVDPAGQITAIGKLHCQLADVLSRKFHMVFTLLPIFVAISALQCFAIGNAVDGVLVLYWTTAALTILISATGFFTVHYWVRPMVANRLREWIDPYLSIWLEDLEKDNLPASKGPAPFSDIWGDVDDLDLEQCAADSCSRGARVMSPGQRVGGDA